MAVKLVINGFFRSGTSVFWKIVRASNPETIVFYEPCHEEILKYIARFTEEPFIDELHNMSLWDEYVAIPGLTERIARKHPNPGLGMVFPEDRDRLLSYIGIYDELPSPTILQSNRWSFALKDIAERFETGLIHIIRNPFDVFDSMTRIYFNQGSALKQMVKKGGKPLFASNAFQIGVMFDQVHKLTGKPAVNLTSLERLHYSLNAFDAFLVAWVMSNRAAVADVMAKDGMIISYENFLKHPEEGKKEIESRFDISFDCMKTLNAPIRIDAVTQDEERYLTDRAKKLGLSDEMSFLLHRMKM